MRSEVVSIHASVGREAAPILNALTTAKRACVWLAHRGFRPLEVLIGPRNPQIWITTSPRCATLDGAPCIRRFVCGYRETVMVALVEGCEVRWIERGN